MANTKTFYGFGMDSILSLLTLVKWFATAFVIGERTHSSHSERVIA